jgi:hypothetical protein
MLIQRYYCIMLINGIHFSSGCCPCISAGYTDCLRPNYVAHPDYQWQENEDRQRSDRDYIELLDLGFETEIDEADQNLNWMEWENSLESMEVIWKEPQENRIYGGCGRHGFREGLGRIHRYILHR